MKYKNPQSIKSYVQNLAFPRGDTYRGNCPVCGAKNTFTATKKAGEVVWNCYHAQCTVSGKFKVGYSLSEVSKIKISKPLDTRKSGGPLNDNLPWNDTPVSVNFSIPNSWTGPMGHPAAIAYMKKHGIMEAYADRRTDCLYDPRLNRLIFTIKNTNGQVVGAVGRALNRESRPKWLMYGNPQIPFICRSQVYPATYVIVEDAASAVKVSSVATGFALLGSSFLPNYWTYISGARKLIVALDKDASVKALEIHRSLVYYKNSALVLLEDDIKNMTSLEVERKLEKHLI